jgi:hypothetical protein
MLAYSSAENVSSNNLTYFSFDFWLSQIGSSAYVDTMNLAISIIYAFGLVFNLLFFRILFNNEFKSVNLYSYLKVYLLNSSFICLAGVGLFLVARRYFYPNPQIAAIYLAYFYCYIVITGYFYTSMLDSSY